MWIIQPDFFFNLYLDSLSKEIEFYYDDDTSTIITDDGKLMIVYGDYLIVITGDYMFNADFTKDICDANNEGESFLNDFLKSFKITERNV